MHLIYRNTNDASYDIYHRVVHKFEPAGSRNGDVWRSRRPVSITYTNPMERVNFCPVRDANPFFHLAEAMWMLAGRCDVHFLDLFLSKMKEFSDDGWGFHGAYGHRLLSNYPSPLLRAIDTLREDLKTRRAYASIWHSVWDSEYATVTKDLPCNLGIAFNVYGHQLDATVFNRSNDIVWGGVSGANIVQFAFFLEFAAASINRVPGELTVVSSNFHMYRNEQSERLTTYYTSPAARSFDFYRTDTHVTRFCETPSQAENLRDEAISFCNNFNKRGWQAKIDIVRTLVVPLLDVYYRYKQKTISAQGAYSEIAARAEPEGDWKFAAMKWFERRIK